MQARTRWTTRQHLSRPERLLLAVLLTASSPAPAGTITDTGDVTVVDDVLRIGDMVDGLRVADGMSDGGYLGTVIGNQPDVAGELRLQNAAEFSTAGDLVLGIDGSATVQVTSGSRLVSETTRIGSRSSSPPGCCVSPLDSSVLVSGAGSEWDNSGSIVIGKLAAYGDQHAIEISGGASLVTNGVSVETGYLSLSASVIRIDGQGTSWLNRGSLDTLGYLGFSVTGGARAEDNGVSIAYGNSSSLTVDGSGSEWRTGDFGQSVNGGGLVVQNGGTVVSNSASFFSRTSQRARIDGAGSSWQIAGALGAGGDGGNLIEVTNGGLLHTGSTAISGSWWDFVRVEGAGSRWVNDGAARFGYGDGYRAGAHIMLGGVFESGETAVFCGASSSGSSEGCELLIDGDGSAFQGTGSVFLGGDANGPNARGLLKVQNGGSASAAGPVVAWTGGKIRLDDGSLSSPTIRLEGGNLEGSGLVDGDLENRGRVAPTAGGSPIRVSSDYLQDPSAALAIELRPDGDESLLEILGHSVLAGALSISLTAGFSPQLGDAFTVMRFASFEGLFDSYSGLDLGGGLALAPEYSPQSVVLRVIPEPSTALFMGIGLGLLARRSPTPRSRRSRSPGSV